MASDKEENGTPPTSDEESTKFTVEKILDKRRNQITGIIEYYVKWNGYQENNSTWEEEGDLDCDDLIAEFEAENKGREATSTVMPKRAKNKTNDEKVKVLEKITSALVKDGKMMFAIKWVGIEEPVYESAEVVNRDFPQFVIKFYENLMFDE